jgi:peptidoglycan/xylan/chitin deacetylase (PgdA/CDA1 family)
MWRFRIITGIFAAITLTVILAPVPGPSRFCLLGIDILLYVAIVAVGSSRINSQMFMPAICRGDPESRQVAITFDDGPHPQRSAEIMETLEGSGARASFFLTGKKAVGHEQIVKRMADSGHTIGNHTYSHSRLFPFFPAGRIAGEVTSTSRLLERFTGQKVRYFRPPFGVTNPNIARGLRGLNMKVVGWSIRSFDTRNEHPEKVVKRISCRVAGGEIILLHETSEHILEILTRLLELLDEKGLEAVSLDEMFENRN